MDLVERIERRRTHRDNATLVADWGALNPAVHLPEPVGREYVVEALLDEIDGIFEGRTPPNVYLWGPAGSGKSAIVTALMSALHQTVSRQQQAIHTATRIGGVEDEYRFVYLDSREAGSRFKRYREMLNLLVDEQVPKRGLRTEDLRERLVGELDAVGGLLVAVDHLGEPDTADWATLEEDLGPFEGVFWIGVGHEGPGNVLPGAVRRGIEVPAYNYEIVDILTTRGAVGLSSGIDHTHAKDLAEWAEGNAHDALAALFGAAVEAEADGRTALEDAHIQAGKRAVPKGGVSIGRVFKQPANKQRVLHALLGVGEEELSIDTAAERIAGRTDLSQGTVRRYIYELAQEGVLRRQEVPIESGTAGRRPSVAVPQFPTVVFERLSDADSAESG